MTQPIIRSGGRFYSVTGHTAAVIAASLSTDTTLMSARMITSAVRKAYIQELIVRMELATAGAAGGIATILGLQRFTTATPSGGNQRTAVKLSATKPSAADVSEMTDIRDNNAALTVTSVVFGDVLDSCLVPNGSTNVAPITWEYRPAVPTELVAGDGICLRTRNAGPATATWVFSWSMRWHESTRT